MGNALKDTLQEEIVNTLEKHLSLVKGQNCTYSDSSEFIVWSTIHFESITRNTVVCN